MTEQAGDNRWVENLLRPVLLAGMMACLTAPPVKLLEWLIGDWQGTYFTVFCFLAGLEGILSERMLQKRRITGWAYLGSRLAEALILLLLLKMANYIPLGLEKLWADALAWPADPYSFFSSLDLLSGALFLLLWGGAIAVARAVMELDIEDDRGSPPEDKTSTEYYLWLTQPPVVRFRQQQLDGLGELFLWGGITLVLASAGVHFAVSSARTLALPLLLYFALGVALLSQARFSVTHASWRLQGITIQAGIGRRWLLWTVVFVVGVALAALLLPTGYTMGPLSALLALVGLLFRAVVGFLTIVYLLLIWLLSLLLPGRVERPDVPLPSAESIVGSEPAPVSSQAPWLDIVMAVLFWTTILTIVGYALLRFVRDRLGELPEGEAGTGPWWGRLLAWLRALWDRLLAWRQGVQAELAERRARRQKPELPAERPFRFLSVGRLPPREQVRYFYLSTARRAAQAGRARRADQTPYEYEESLDQGFPDLEPDLGGLTEAFVVARYSRRPVEEEEVQAAKSWWQRLKAALRQRRLRSQ